MEKILVVINANKPSIPAIDFACYMASLTKTKLTGLFIENVFFDYIPDYNIDRAAYFKPVMERGSETAVAADMEQAVNLFKEACQRKGVLSQVYVDKGEPIREILYESRFADLLIVDPDIDFHDRGKSSPFHLIKEILAKAKCPVLLAPNSFDTIDQIVFCCDGSVSSIYAIKQFTYLLPQFSDKTVMLLEVNGRVEFKDENRIMDWLRTHYHSVYFHSLKGNVEDELFAYFFMNTNKLVVMGAYGRSFLSTLFKKSRADILVRTVDLPLFITRY